MSRPRSLNFLECITSAIASAEEKDVKKFLQESEEFKTMKEIAKTMPSRSWTDGVPNPAQEQEVVDKIEKATCFSDILDATSSLNFKHSPATRYTVGLLFSVGGNFNQQLNFGHYMLNLREKADTKMSELSYKLGSSSSAPKASR